MRFSLWIVIGVVFLHSFSASADSAWNWNSRTMNAHADITGDGKPETIRLQSFGIKQEGRWYGDCYFRLAVNNRYIYDSENVTGFILCDINRHDRWKEIVVGLDCEFGDRDGYMIYRFNGKSMHRVTQRPLERLKFFGDGRVQVNQGVNELFFVLVPYDLQRNHTLRRRNQKYYAVGINETVKEPFPIYSRPGNKKIAMLRIGTKVRILNSDLGNWLYIRAGRSTYGWMNQRWNNAYRAFGISSAGG